MAWTKRPTASSANVVAPREGDRHPLTAAHPAKVFELHRGQRVSEGSLLEPLLKHRDGCSGCLPPTATPAPAAATSHAHSTPIAERMALEMRSTSPTPLIR